MGISGIGAPTTSSILSAIYGVGGGAGGGSGQQSGGTPLNPALFNNLVTGSTLAATFGSGPSITIRACSRRSPELWRQRAGLFPGAEQRSLRPADLNEPA